MARSDLKVAEVYPGSVDNDDRVTFKHNRQGQVKETKDQNGTVHTFNFDGLGRPVQDRVTTFGTDVDGAVRRIATAYEVRGMREKLTSYDNATVGSGTIVNEVQFAYNDFAQLTDDYQSHSGAVNTMTTPKVQYGYADGSGNTIRPTTLTYPDGRVLTYGYGTSSGMSDASSRVESIIDDDVSSTHLADYAYLGLATFIEVDYTEPEIRYTLVGTAGGNDPDTGDIYRGLDRFGRIKDSYWHDYGSSADVDRIKYGYDRASNRIWCENTVAAASGAHFDELYTNDAIHRLKSLDRGTLNAQRDAVTNAQFAECWSLDPTGNWKNFRQDDDGDGTWDLNQNRTANKVNEITDVTQSAGPSWVTPAYSRAGNMTTIPKPADPTVAFTATYDAWNRLVKIVEGSDTVAENAYDGAKRRVIAKAYTGGVLDETRHLYYTEPSRWQVVEERVDSGSDPERQFVWGLRYVDDLIARDRDTDADGTLDERLYALQDANWNVTAIGDTTGSIQERYAYTAYGVPFVLTPAFASRATSSFNWETRYAGYRWDDSASSYHVRNRVYHATVGTWLQRDPISMARMSNLYEYAASRPLNSTDPSGEIPIPVAGCLGAAAGSVIGSIVRGEGFCEAACKAGISCIVGAIGSSVAAAFPSIAGCILGATVGLANTTGKLVCEPLCGCGFPPGEKVGCELTSAALTAALGCLLNARIEMSPAEQEALAKALALAVGAIVGADISMGCIFAVT